MGKNSSKEWKLINIALWGYSTVMLLFLTFFTLIPTGSGSGSADPIAGIFSLLPIVLFFVSVIFELKKYKWNTLKVSLFVYS
ncbi:MAG: hypothetical protein KGL95_02635, partial [Patescibacteria group bacterium]|nr:hypothetical protein [Patescibacteria group bacterium]